MKSAIRLSPEDNLLVALEELFSNQTIEEENVTCVEGIPAGHKLAVEDIPAHAPLIKYGQIIGFASRHIHPGEHVHVHNVSLKGFRREIHLNENTSSTESPVAETRRFLGFVREDGKIGTRNYIGVLATANCATFAARLIARSFPPDQLAEYKNVDGVVALGHGYGCGTASNNLGFVYLQRTLAGYARHPNFAGVLIVGLGCEKNQIESLLSNYDLPTDPQLQAVNIQDLGGTAATVRRGHEVISSMLRQANQYTRQPVSARHLVLALECGGSDAYSGITANPALGVAVDRLVRQGGTAILSETPEIYGAEHLLTRRAVNRTVGLKLLERIKWWEEYTAHYQITLNNNPSPGNLAGGLTTILEKSLGAVSKGGGTNLIEVYGYAEPVVDRGLVFMDTPGYDPVSVTGMVAGGANAVCFTTGRGSVSGGKPVPVLKLASNQKLFEKMSDDMDLNCGLILEAGSRVEQMGDAIFDLVLETASGRPTKSEMMGFGEDEFVPWQIGAVL